MLHKYVHHKHHRLKVSGEYKQRGSDG